MHYTATQKGVHQGVHTQQEATANADSLMGNECIFITYVERSLYLLIHVS